MAAHPLDRPLLDNREAPPEPETQTRCNTTPSTAHSLDRPCQRVPGLGLSDNQMVRPLTGREPDTCSRGGGAPVHLHEGREVSLEIFVDARVVRLLALWRALESREELLEGHAL